MQLEYMYRALKLIYLNGKYWFLFAVLTRLVLGFAPVSSVLVIQQLVNQIVNFVQGKDVLTDITFLLFLQFVILFMQVAVHNIQRIYDLKIEQKIDYVLEKAVSEKASSVPLAYFDSPVFLNHHDRIQGRLGERLISPIKMILDIGQNVITLIAYLWFMLNIHWLLAVCSVLLVFPVFITHKKYGNRQFLLLKYQTPSAREAMYLTSLLNDRDAAKEVRLFQLHDHFIHRWSRIFQKHNLEYYKLTKKKELAVMFLHLANSLVFILNAVILVRLLIINSLQVGSFVAVLQAVQGTQNTLNDLSTRLAQMYSEWLYIHDLYSFLEYEDPEYIQTGGDDKFPHIQRGITLNHVSFTYPYSSRKVLKNISITINKGEKVAIVGENGSGKTTLVKCLMGLYPLQEGEILFDDISISQIKRSELFNNITVIFQDFQRYSFTVRENISVGNIAEQRNLSKITRIAQETGAHEFIRNMKDGYETVLGKILRDGEDLSGGQWQKIALARAMMKEGEIFILDEPTSALDPKAELEVFEEFEKICKNKTTIFISHRMASAKIADKIIVMKDGEILETGTHQELMLKNNEYAGMYNRQARWFA